MEVLHDVQGLYGYLPEEVLRRVSASFDVPLIEVFRLANFYKAFSLKPRGRHLLTVCAGTACHVRGAPRLLDEVLAQLEVAPGDTTADRAFTLETVNCLGACALGPVVVIDGTYHDHMTPAKLKALWRDPRADSRRSEARTIHRGDRQCLDCRARRPWRRSGRSWPGSGRRGPCASRCPAAPAARLRARSRVSRRSQALDEHGLTDEVHVRVTGCQGFCQQEPLLIVEPLDVLYCKVTPEDVAEIVAESVVNGRVVERLCFADETTGQIARTPADLPFFAKQDRELIGRNRLVDPCDIGDYIAAGGYSALAQVLTSMDPEAVIERDQDRPVCGGAAAAGTRPPASGSSAGAPPATSATSSATPTRATPAPTWTAGCWRAIPTRSSRG